MNVPSAVRSNSFLNKTLMKNKVAIQATKTMGPIFSRNGINAMSFADPIIRFGGSPTRVATPPVSDKSAAAIRYGIGVTFIFWQMSTINGPKITTVVTLSSKREIKVTAVPIIASMRNCRPFAKRPIS